MYHNISHILQVVVLSIVDVPHPDYLEHQDALNVDPDVSIDYVSIPFTLLRRMLLIQSVNGHSPPIQGPLSKAHQATA